MRLDVGNLKLFGLDLNQAFAWWREGLRAAVPAWLIPSFMRPSPRLIASWDGQQLVLSVPEGRDLARLEAAALDVAADAVLLADIQAAGLDPAKVRLELELSADQLLYRPVDLPQSEPEKLREMLRWQLPRLTPFSADQLYYTAAADASGSPCMLAVPRSHVDPLIQHVQRLTSLTVAGLFPLPSGRKGLPRVNLFARSPVPSRWWRRLNHNSLLLVLLLFSLGAAVLTPVWVAREHVIERKQELFRVHAEVVDTLTTRDQLTQNLQLITALQAERTLPSVSLVLAELSARVPDSIFLTELRIDGELIRLSGNGLEVVNLIDQLNASPILTDARFTSSVNRNARTGLDQFTASVQLLPQQQEGAP